MLKPFGKSWRKEIASLRGTHDFKEVCVQVPRAVQLPFFSFAELVHGLTNDWANTHVSIHRPSLPDVTSHIFLVRLDNEIKF